MSSAQPIRPRQVGQATLSFAIVASQFNHEYTQGLVTNTHQELGELETGCRVKLLWVPGAFEIPLFVKQVAAQKRYNAVIALGVILQGATAHGTLISQSVTNALQNLALEFNTPIIHEVLLVDNEEQARERCLEQRINRGVEAARAAVSAARIIRELSK